MDWPKQIQQKEEGHPDQPTKDHWHKPSSVKQCSSTKHNRNKAVKRTTTKAIGKPKQTNQTITPFNTKTDREREKRQTKGSSPVLLFSFFLNQDNQSHLKKGAQDIINRQALSKISSEWRPCSCVAIIKRCNLLKILRTA